MKTDEIKYGDAIEEIESTLELIEEGSLGVDDLTQKVERVTKLLKVCRDKLYTTEKQVNSILASEDQENKVE